MEEETIKRFLIFIKEEYEKTEEFEKRYYEKRDQINKKYKFSIDLNLHTPASHSNWSKKDKLNILFKNSIKSCSSYKNGT